MDKKWNAHIVAVQVVGQITANVKSASALVSFVNLVITTTVKAAHIRIYNFKAKKNLLNINSDLRTAPTQLP